VSDPLCDDNLIKEQREGYTLWLRQDLAVDRVLELMRQPGEVLKQSRKSEVRRVGAWAVKESRGRFGAGLLKHTFRRDHYRRGWLAAHHLLRHRILVPKPLAYAESGRFGLITRNILITEYLQDHVNVEQYSRQMAEEGATQRMVDRFFANLAHSINALYDSGAWHADLSGKNILTKNGVLFYFIDLDAVHLNEPYTEERRMKNHVQIYDSFCDLFRDTVLVPFLGQLIEPHQDLRVWMPRVRQGQVDRRKRTVALWEKQARRAQKKAGRVETVQVLER
jgi:hypothetical protein